MKLVDQHPRVPSLKLMTRDEFIGRIRGAISVGITFRNPGGGTSRIENVNPRYIAYVRGHSTITFSLHHLYYAYAHFAGRRVSSTDLREFAPSIFDSAARPAGHSCNCTFFFQVLQEAGLASSLQGTGVRGDPYAVTLPSQNGFPHKPITRPDDEAQ